MLHTGIDKPIKTASFWGEKESDVFILQYPCGVPTENAGVTGNFSYW